jgi:hypothetical protein
MHDQPITIRSATPSDAPDIARLAALDRRPGLRGHVLLAEQEGLPVTALALTSGAAAGDPRSVPALRLRRYQLLRQGGHVGRLPRPAVAA